MRPHILLLLADDWGSYDASHRIRSLGREPDVHTPTIDRLSADGVTLSNYYVQPICSPTRASLLSGRYSIHTGSEHRLWGWSEASCLPIALPLMPRAFKELNYSTAMVGKWHLGYVNDTCSPWTRGFDSYLGYLNGNEGYYQHGISTGQDFHQCADGTGQGSPATSACDGCTPLYEGRYSTHVYTEHVQGLLRAWSVGAAPLFIYAAYQAVHEPMEAPDEYVAKFAHIGDPSRRLYAAMLLALDEGIGNITATLAAQHMLDDSVVVLSNDNGGMSGSYGIGCCNCGTSCGGLNYPYRGWKDSFYEGGFRGIGFAYAPSRLRANATFAPLLWVGDWYRTLLGAALADDTPAAHAVATAALAPLLAAGPIDSVDQWSALVAAGAPPSSLPPPPPPPPPPREEVLLAGIDVDRNAAAIRVGRHKLLVGGWGSPLWCDLNVSGFSPAYPVPPGNASQGLAGGEGGLHCMDLGAAAAAGDDADGDDASMVEKAADDPPPAWWAQVAGLYDVVSDPRELNDLQHSLPDVVSKLRARLIEFNATTAPTAHADNDPAGQAHAKATGCYGPWR